MPTPKPSRALDVALDVVGSAVAVVLAMALTLVALFCAFSGAGSDGYSQRAALREAAAVVRDLVHPTPAPASGRTE